MSKEWEKESLTQAMANINNTSAADALCKLLIRLNLITSADYAGAYNNKSLSPIAFFANSGKFDELSAIKAVGEFFHLPVLQFDRRNAERIGAILSDPKVAAVSLVRWQSCSAIPVELGNGELLVAWANPLQNDLKKALEFDLGLKINMAIATQSQIDAMLGRRWNDLDDDTLRAAQTKADDSKVKLTLASASESNISTLDMSAAPVVRIVNSVLAEGVELGASDIHLAPEVEKMVVRVRIDGILRELQEIPAALQQPVISRLKLLCGMDIAEKRKPQDGRLRIKSSQGTRDLRVSSLPTAHGETVVIRILTSDFSRLSFDRLEMPEKIEDRFKAALKGSSRVILVTGPTGSGKTSTLYTALLSLRDGTRNIITVEDPIEYRIQGINQVQTNSKIGMGFAESLRSMLRQDPDVVMVGEIRDQETATIALQAAQTGHLVLSTIHTNSAPAAVTRLDDLGVPPHVIASALGGIMAQRLVRRLCSNCAEPLTESRYSQYEGLDFSNAELAAIRTSKGCECCGNSGFAGRVGLYSFLDISDEVREVIRERGGEIEMARVARNSGFTTLVEHARELLKAGVTSLQELERVLGALPRAYQENLLLRPSGEPVAENNGPGLNRRLVLLVEDDANIRAILTMVLESQSYEVVEAANGLEGLSMMHERVPDVILCDLMMPKMNGLELLRKVRSDPRIAKLPFLLLTAADSEENELNLIGAGADDFISKTSDTKVLLARLDRVFRN